MTDQTPDVEPLVWSVREVAKLLSVSTAHVYALIDSGQLPVLRLGHRKLVPKVALERLLATPS